MVVVAVCAGSSLLAVWVLDIDTTARGLLVLPTQPCLRTHTPTLTPLHPPHPPSPLPQGKALLQADGVNRARLRHLQDTCAQNHSYFIPADSRSIESLAELVVDAERGLAYCYIPKVASSTLKRVFHVLAGRNSWPRPLQPVRQGHPQSLINSLHLPLQVQGILRNRSSKYQLLGSLLEGRTLVRQYQLLTSLTKVVFVRDPYERIFSAFVDRLFRVAENLYSMIPALHKSQHHHPGYSSSCDLNVTFTDVIRYVTTTAVTELDEHFGPYYSVCFPCHVNYDFLGKLETFRRDLSLVLTSAGVQPRSVLGDDDAFDVDSDVNILQDVVRRTFEMLEFSVYRDCFTKYRMLKRTWTAFQVRGFLPIHTLFPLTPDNAEDVTLTQFDNLVKAAYLEVSNHARVRDQREMALKEAYYSIPRELLLQLQKVVQRDCDLFGYECSVEMRFKEGENCACVPF